MIEICKKLAEVQEMLRANPNSGVLGIHLIFYHAKPTITVHVASREFDKNIAPNFDYEIMRRRSFDYPVSRAATICGITVEALYSEQECCSASVE